MAECVATAIVSTLSQSRNTSSLWFYVNRKIPMKIHYLPNTDVARDACNNGTTENGDVLVIESEQVVGVSSFFQFAVTVKTGDMFEFLVDYPTGPAEFLTLVNGIRAAVAEAERLGYEVVPQLAALSLSPPRS
jgi:hypothetical protein